MATSLKIILGQVVKLWLKQIELAQNRKSREFDDTAREIMLYVGQKVDKQRLNLLIDGLPPEGNSEDGTMSTLNWTQLFVDCMAPYVYAQIPNRLASPIRPPLPPEIAQAAPMVMQLQGQKDLQDRFVCFELQWLLNWTPRVYDAKHEGRMVVQEALAKGMGTSWLEMDDAPVRAPDGTPYQMPTMRADSVDNFLVDPDCAHLRDAGFIIKRCRMPAYKVAELYGEDANAIRAAAKEFYSSNLQVAAQTVLQPGIAELESDVVTFYKIWSKIGLGDKLVHADDQLTMQEQPVADAIDSIGSYVHFAILEGMDHPLGVDSDKLVAIASASADNTTTISRKPSNAQEPDAPNDLIGVQPTGGDNQANQANQKLLSVLQAALEWPIKTYGCAANPWPVAVLGFRPRIESPWHKAILEAALPLQRFLDRLYAHIIGRVNRAGRNVCLYDPVVTDDLTSALQSQADLQMVAVAGGVSKEQIDKLVNFIKFPELNKDVFEILNICWETFREITGTDPALLGGIPKSQDRSAKASSVRESGLSRRPDDYAESVEAWESQKSALEAIAARMLVDYNLIAKVFGEDVQMLPDQPAQMGQDGQQMPTQPAAPNWTNMPLTQIWQSQVHTDDEFQAASEINYQIEAGSGKRKNKQLAQQNAQQMFTMFGQQSFATAIETGDPKPWAILARMMGDAFDMDMEPYLNAMLGSMQQQAMMQQQQAAQGQQGAGPTKPGQAPSGGGSPAQQSANTPGAGKLTTSWVRAAGGPSGPHIQPAPETNGMM